MCQNTSIHYKSIKIRLFKSPVNIRKSNEDSHFKPMVTYHVVFPLTYPFHIKRYPIAPNTWSPSPADSEEAEVIKAPEKPGWARLLPPEGAVGSRSPAP